MVDEINRLLMDSLNTYLSENKVEVLGNPLPKRDENSVIDWDNQKDFEFTYEMGLAPKFSVELSGKETQGICAFSPLSLMGTRGYSLEALLNCWLEEWKVWNTS